MDVSQLSQILIHLVNLVNGQSQLFFDGLDGGVAGVSPAEGVADDGTKRSDFRQETGEGFPLTPLTVHLINQIKLIA